MNVPATLLIERPKPKGKGDPFWITFFIGHKSTIDD